MAQRSWHWARIVWASRIPEHAESDIPGKLETDPESQAEKRREEKAGEADKIISERDKIKGRYGMGRKEPGRNF